MKPRTPEHCANLSAALTGRRLSPDHIANMSAATKGRTLSPEHCANISAGLKGKRPSDAALAAAAIANRAKRVFSDEAKARMREGQRRGRAVPKWVPDDLLGEFKEVLALSKCEIEACRHIRGLLREMRV